MRRYTKEELYIEELKSKLYDMVCDADIVVEVCESIDDDNEGEFDTKEVKIGDFVNNNMIDATIEDEIEEAVRDLVFDYEYDIPKREIEVKVNEIVEFIYDLYSEVMSDKLTEELGNEAAFREWLES